MLDSIARSRARESGAIPTRAVTYVTPKGSRRNSRSARPCSHVPPSSSSFAEKTECKPRVWSSRKADTTLVYFIIGHGPGCDPVELGRPSGAADAAFIACIVHVVMPGTHVRSDYRRDRLTLGPGTSAFMHHANTKWAVVPNITLNNLTYPRATTI